MVATSQPLAAQAGLQMIALGGNAADAAIASAITLTLVEPTGCGSGPIIAILWDVSNFMVSTPRAVRLPNLIPRNIME